MKFIRHLSLLCVIALAMTGYRCSRQPEFYSPDDFIKVPKIDAHFHYATRDTRFMEFADSLNFSFISPNVDTEMPIEQQLEIASELRAAYPQQFAFLGTFSVDSFNNPGFAAQTIETIRKCMDKGASGIKIWKNIGMELRDSSGKMVMIDNPAFEPVFRYLTEQHIPVLGHLGEPRNCWLPYEEMTDQGDRYYYESHPQYHMYQFPEMPSYEDQLNARDHILLLYPELIFTGAHLGSLEWNVDSLAKTLDRFPKIKVDMAARIGHLKNQSKIDRERVRDFLIKYRDRILYATDMSAYDELLSDFERSVSRMERTWRNDWMYLATDSVINDVQGLKLPKEVIDMIYYKNAEELISGQ